MSELLEPPTAGDAALVSTKDAIDAAAFRSALRTFLRTSEEIARANGLTPRRHQLLLMVKGAPDGSERATLSELAQRLQLAQTTVTELVQRAVDADLLTRERSPNDARLIYLRLSDEGERRLARVFRSHETEREKLREMLTDMGRSTDRPTARRKR